MEPEDSFPFSQQLATDPYPERGESSPKRPNLQDDSKLFCFSKVHYNINL
jgi:hypothetical protein